MVIDKGLKSCCHLSSGVCQSGSHTSRLVEFIWTSSHLPWLDINPIFVFRKFKKRNKEREIKWKMKEKKI